MKLAGSVVWEWDLLCLEVDVLRCLLSNECCRVEAQRPSGDLRWVKRKRCSSSSISSNQSVQQQMSQDISKGMGQQQVFRMVSSTVGKKEKNKKKKKKKMGMMWRWTCKKAEIPQRL